MSRFNANCNVICDNPYELDDVIDCNDAICPNCRSSDAVTRFDIVSGFAPGNCVVTCTVGKSTCGSAETGKPQYPSHPASSTATLSSVVATGRMIKGLETLAK